MHLSGTDLSKQARWQIITMHQKPIIDFGDILLPWKSKCLDSTGASTLTRKSSISTLPLSHRWFANSRNSSLLATAAWHYQWITKQTVLCLTNRTGKQYKRFNSKKVGKSPKWSQYSLYRKWRWLQSGLAIYHSLFRLPSDQQFHPVKYILYRKEH